MAGLQLHLDGWRHVGPAVVGDGGGGEVDRDRGSWRSVFSAFGDLEPLNPRLQVREPNRLGGLDHARQHGLPVCA